MDADHRDKLEQNSISEIALGVGANVLMPKPLLQCWGAASGHGAPTLEEIQ